MAATTDKTDMEIAFELAEKATTNPRRRSGEIRLAKALIDMREKLERATYIAGNLHQMVDRETWRAYGAEWQGQYEGDHHAVQVQDEIERLSALARTGREDG